MKLLAIDTATESCSAALWFNGKIIQRFSVQPRLHAELILPFIDELLTEANINKSAIDGLLVAQGPGAFTGVRIGVAVAQGLALALDIPVLAVSNLKTLAFHAYQQLKTTTKKTILVATDARMNEVYWAHFEVSATDIQPLTTENVSPAQAVDISGIDAYIGSGFNVYPELISYKNKHSMPFESNTYSQAQDMIRMEKDNFFEKATDISQIEPVYLREP